MSRTKAVLVLSGMLVVWWPGVAMGQGTIVIGEETLTENTTWAGSGTIYWLQGTVTVADSVTLTIEPGAIVKFQVASARRCLVVDGTLQAVGAAGDSILFTSDRDDVGGDTNGDGNLTQPSRGDWGYIRLGGSGSVLEYCIVRHGGRHPDRDWAVWIAGTGTVIQQCTFGQSYLGYHLVQEGAASPICSANTFENGKPAVGVYGILAADATWSAQQVPYLLVSPHPADGTGYLEVPPGVTLTLESGVIIKMLLSTLEPARMGRIVVDGRLLAEGTAGSPVTFTSERDDTVGGDTNGDGSQTLPGPGNWGCITLRGPGSRLNHSVVRYGGRHIDGTWTLWIDRCEPTITSCTFSHSFHGQHLVQTGPVSPNYQGNVFTDGRAAIGVHGAIDADVTWPAHEVPYLLVPAFPQQTAAFLEIIAGATLTIEPAAIVKMAIRSTNPEMMSHILVDGALIAQGTSLEPITFTSERDDAVGGDTNGDGAATSPEPGDWGYVRLSGAGSVLDHCVVRYGGLQADREWTVWVDHSEPTITNCTFAKSFQGLHLVQEGPVSPTYGGNSFVDGRAAIGVSGVLDADVIWPSQDVPYLVASEYPSQGRALLVVNPGTTLTLEPGVIVKMMIHEAAAEQMARVLVDGALVAQGTAAAPIAFTSERDDSIGGDTNNDGSQTTPSAGNWGHIRLGGAGSVLDHCVIRYGGRHTDRDWTVWIESTEPAIAHCTFSKSFQGCHVVQEGPVVPTYQVNTFVDGKAAIGVTGDLDADVTWSSLDVPYLVVSAHPGDGCASLRVAPGTTLTLDPGVIIKMLMESTVPEEMAVILVEGRLVAVGTEIQPVVITSLRDDSVGGDTNRDGNFTVPSSGDWGYVKLMGSGSTLEHCSVAYGGRHADANCLLWLTAPNTTVTRTILRETRGIAVLGDAPCLCLTELTISGAEDGIRVNSDPSQVDSALVQLNVIERVSGVGIHYIGDTDLSRPVIGGGNLIAGSSVGIWCESVAESTTITENIIEECCIGIRLNMARATVSGNIVRQTGAGVGTGQAIVVESQCTIELSDNAIIGWATGLQCVTDPGCAPSNLQVHDNLVTDNAAYGLFLQSADGQSTHGPQAVIHANCLYANGLFDLYLGPYLDPENTHVDATQNWWGTTDPAQIALRIHDRTDHQASPTADFEPFLDHCHIGGTAPSVRVNPTAVAAALFPDEITDETITIENLGIETLAFEIIESEVIPPRYLTGVRRGSEQLLTDVSWLSVEPDTGSVLSGTAVQVVVTLDARSIPDGDYQAYLIVQSNDPANPEVVVSVDMMVSHVYLMGPADGDTLDIGEVCPLAWVTHQPGEVSAIDLEVSGDGGVSFPHAIGIGLPNVPPFDWTVLGPMSLTCKLRIVAHYVNGPARADTTEGLFAIVGTSAGIAPSPSSRATQLGQSAPNPFGESTRIPYVLSASGHVRMMVFDLRGRLVRTVVDGWQSAGPHGAIWDGCDAQGKPVGAGVYFYRLEAEPGRTLLRRVVLLR